MNLRLENVMEANETIKNLIKKTPIVECPILEEMTGNRIYLKLENLQKTGSFKVRGALNKIANLTESEKKAGVIASSAGNHAQGVALGAKIQGIKATIVMPKTAPYAKVKATKSYGAEVILEGTVYDDAYKKAFEIHKEEGATFVHPFDDIHVIAGQGTIGLEIVDEIKNVDVVIVPIGGGGIISGIAKTIKLIKPDVKIIGVQTENIPSMKVSFENKEIIEVDAKPTIADGIAVKKPGTNTFEIIKDSVDEIVTVTEDEISKAMLFLLEKSKVVTEGAGAVSVAALLSNKISEKDKTICAVISGGNIDMSILEKIINKALILEGRRFNFTTEIADKVGELGKIVDVICNLNANVLEVNQTMYSGGLNIKLQEVRFALECLDWTHQNKIKEELEKLGYKIY